MKTLLVINRSSSVRNFNEKSLLKYWDSLQNECAEFLQKKLKLPLAECAFEFSVYFCGKDRIQTLNKKWRGKDKATDVLSFPAYDTLRTAKGQKELITPHVHLGDVCICLDVAQKQAAEFKINVESEIMHLILHGFLHLCGFDHELSSKEGKIMMGLEEELVEKLANVMKNKKTKNKR